MACLTHHVPAAVVHLLGRCLTGQRTLSARVLPQLPPNASAGAERHVSAAVLWLAHRSNCGMRVTGDFRLEEGVVAAAEACAGCMEQLAHHAYGKTALREADAIKRELSLPLPSPRSCSRCSRCRACCGAVLGMLTRHVGDCERVVRCADLGVMLTFLAYQPGALRKATAALMALSVEKESKVPVILHAGRQLVHLLQVSSTARTSAAHHASLPLPLTRAAKLGVRYGARGRSPSPSLAPPLPPRGAQASHDERLVTNTRATLVSACEHLEARMVVQTMLTEADMKATLYQGPLPNTPPDFRYQVIMPSGP